MRKFITLFPIITSVLFLINIPSLVLAEEPGLQQWFNANSYIIDVATNKTGMGTFPAGQYRATIMAELAMYAPNNTFGWYSVATGALHQLFAGEDTVNDTVDFSPTETFGVYIGSPEGTFYSEKNRNSDQSDHAWVFQDPKSEGGYVTAWEDLLNGGDKDYQDMVIAMRALRLPHAAFSWYPPKPQVNETVTFNASDSTGGEGYITSYKWDFDDDNTTTTSSPIITHVYSNSGNFTAILNVTNNEGKGDSISHTVTVIAPPHASYSYSPLEPEVNEPVTFDASASTPDGGTIVSYRWNFGDGNTTAIGSPILAHAFSSFGNYTVTLNITDSEGLSHNVSHTITVRAKPHAAFSYQPLPPLANETVTFDASTSTPDGGTIVSYEWNLGDGNITAVSNPIITHVYPSFGDYNVTLNVTDTEGKSASTSHMVTVVALPHAAFVYSPLSPKVNELVTFNASASTPDGGTIVSYEWKFGDDSPAKVGTVCTHRYVTAGDFIVTLNVTDSEGKWDTESKILEVHEPAEFIVTIEDQWTTPEDKYEFTAPAYCKTFKVEVRIVNAADMFGYEFWLEFDPTLIQLTDHEVKHLHTEDLVALEEVDNTTGTYKQAVTAKAPSQPYNGSAVVANLWFHIIKDPCYPYNYTSMLRLNNTKMTDPNGTAIENLQKNGYFDFLSVQPKIGIESEGKTGIVNWIANSTFSVDINLTNIIRMKGFYIELEWCDCLETDFQNVEVTGFLPPPYELYIVNMSATTLTVQVRASSENSAINGTGFLLRVTFKAKNPWGGIPPYSLVGDKYLPDNCTCKISFVRGWIDVYCPEYRKMEFYNSSYGVNVKSDFSYAFTPIPGDLNLDGVVDIVDLSAISSHIDCKSGDPEWAECYRFDLTGDGSIDLVDVVIVATNVGRTHP